jgi:hypothetical protein
MSIPADTPAAVTILPWGTTRSCVVEPTSGASSPIAAQCVVASRPRSRPAVPRISEPVQTEVVHCVVSWTLASQAWSGPGSSIARVPGPPGTTTMSGESTSSSVSSTVMASMRVSARTGPVRSPTNVTSAPGRRDSTS